MSALAGRLSERLTLDRPDAARDAIGSAPGGWIAAGTAAAEIVPDGRDAWRVTLRTPSAVGEGWRLTWGAVRLRVTDVVADPRAPDRILLKAEEMR